MDKMKALVVIASVALTAPVVIVALYKEVYWFALIALVLGMLGVISAAANTPKNNEL